MALTLIGDNPRAFGPGSVKQNARSVLGRLPDPRRRHAITVAGSPPTITYGNAATITDRKVAATARNLSFLGHGSSWDNSSFTSFPGLTNNVGLDFVFTGTQLEFGWKCQVSNSEIFWIFVDGEALTAAPAAIGLATTAGNNYFGKIAFGGAGTRRITILTSAVAAWPPLNLELNGIINPAPRRLKIALVGDSFMAGSDGTPSVFNVPPAIIGQSLDAEIVNCSWGGTGYVQPGSFTTFGSLTRRDAIRQSGGVDLIVFVGSVNDDGLPGIQLAASRCFADYAARFPGVPQIVCGPQPTTDTATLSVNRQQNNAAVAMAASSASHVIAYHDMIGTRYGTPQPWVNNGVYNVGDLMTYLGSVWTWSGANGDVTYTPISIDPRWDLVTWDYWGTGRVGATAGGPRDVLLHTDGVHPTTAGSRVLANRLSAAIRQSLVNYVAA